MAILTKCFFPYLNPTSYLKKRRSADAHHWTVILLNRQKQPPTTCLLKFRNILKKTPVFLSLLNKVTGRKACSFIKKTPTQMFFCEHGEISKSTYFEEHLHNKTASEVTLGNDCLGLSSWTVAFKTILS